jgi:hypothetical protein
MLCILDSLGLNGLKLNTNITGLWSEGNKVLSKRHSALFYTVETVNPLAYTHGCETVWAIDVFAFSSSFLPVDGMTCHISF